MCRKVYKLLLIRYIMETLTVQFPDEYLRSRFEAWFLDAGGEDSYFQAAEYDDSGDSENVSFSWDKDKHEITVNREEAE